MPNALAKFQKHNMTTISGQQQKIDTLLLNLQSAEEDINKINTLNELGWELIMEADFSKSKEYFKIAEQLAQKLCYREGIANSLSYMGRIFEFEGDYVRSLEYQFGALKIREEIQDKKGISYSLHYLGDIYLSQADISNDFSDKVEYSNKALEQFLKSLKVAEDINDIQSIANTYNCIGNSFREQENNIKAIEFYNKALKLREELGDKQGFAVTYNNLGKLYVKKKDYQEALAYFFKSLKLAEEIGDKRAIVKVLGTIGSCYLKHGNYSKAYEYCSKSLSLGKKINYTEFIANANYSLSQIYESKKFENHNSDIALKYYKEYIKGRDSINTRKLVQAEINFEFEKKEILRKAEQDKKDAVALVIEKKNREILDSIHYALLIQQAVLPVKKDIYKALKDVFILYKPKDIVSGDFYFFHKNEKYIFIASADCTGHGVPGAFMSMIGSEKLKEAVLQSTDTSEILKTLNKGIKTSLKQSDSYESTRDGMDIALCSIDTVNCIVKYAGANRPLWIIRKGQGVVDEIKATKKAIGGFTEDSQHFETHEIKLQKGDTFYISTDGYADTFSVQDKKLTTKKFKELLLSIQDKSMQDQELHLENFIENWKGGAEQIDDILVIGVQL
jgi:serine phosphatase RsbU (regulator of sigma subunit)